MSVAVNNVSVSYDRTEVLDGVSLEIAEGEIHVLLGESGSGKTTLLRAIAGFEAVDKGEIVLHGRTVDGATWVPPEQRDIGFVFQDYALFPHLSVLRNVEFGIRGQRDRAETLLSQVKLGAYADRPVADLSGGEQQRVALARALARTPKVMLFDEAFCNLHASLRTELRRDTLQILRESAVTAIFVTHDPKEALSMADRITTLDRGRVLMTASPKDMYERPISFAAAQALGPVCVIPRDAPFLGSVSGNGASALVRPEQVELRAGTAGTVIHVEFAGAVDDVTVDIGGATLMAHAPPRTITLGQSVDVSVAGTCHTVEE